MNYALYPSPVGQIIITVDGGAVTGLRFAGEKNEPCFSEVFDTPHPSDNAVKMCRLWLDSYFSGNRPSADALPLALCGTPFQRKVWDELLKIPYGCTVTYGQLANTIAAKMGVEKMSAQAVGGAVGRNPVSLIVPCHRVIGAHGKMTGYAGGICRKIWLLEHEGVMLSNDVK